LSLELDHADAAAPEAMGFVLAGGRSSRMGEDKALVEFDSQPLVAHALQFFAMRDFRPGLPEPALRSISLPRLSKTKSRTGVLWLGFVRLWQLLRRGSRFSFRSMRRSCRRRF